MLTLAQQSIHQHPCLTPNDSAPAFSSETLRGITIPMLLIAGRADQNVPIASSAQYFVKHIRGSKLVLFDRVAHYDFLGTCTALGRERIPLLCASNPGVDRDRVHRDAAELAIRFFDAHLKAR